MSTILKIQPEAAPKMVAASVSPKMAYDADGSRTTTQATDRQSGLPLWRVSVFVMAEDATHAPEQLSVTVPATVAPALPVLQPVAFTGLRVMLWSGGASLRADGVEPLARDAAPASSFLSDIEEVEQ